MTAVRADPRSAEAHYNLGNACYTSGRFEKAIARFERAADLDPGDPDVHHNFAAAYRRVGQHEDTARDLVIEQRLPQAGKHR